MTVTCRPLCVFVWLFSYATIVEKVTTIAGNTFNRYGSVAPRVCDRGFSMFSHRKVAESSAAGFFCSVLFLGWWLSFEPNFEAQLALEVPQRALRPSSSVLSHSRDRRFDLAGSACDYDRLSAADRCRSFASVRKMTSEARIRREKQKFGRSACKRSV